MKNDGGPAFPSFENRDDQQVEAGHLSRYLAADGDGMSLRDYFAAHAPPLPYKLYDLAMEHAKCDSSKFSHGEKCETLCGIIAKWNYGFADRMIAEREGKNR